MYNGGSYLELGNVVIMRRFMFITQINTIRISKMIKSRRIKEEDYMANTQRREIIKGFGRKT
jgi:hypothetical protein